MPRPTTLLTWRDFEGEFDGVPIEAGQYQASLLQNLYKKQGALVRRAGISPLGSAALSPDQDLDSLDWLKIGSTEYLLAAHNGLLTDWLHATPGTTVTNSTGKFTSGLEVNGAWIDAHFILGDGTNPLIRFNGTRVDQLMPHVAPGTPTTADNGAGNLTGTYTWKIVWLSADGEESEMSPASASSGSITARQRRITRPTAPASSTDWSGWSVYRTANGGTTYKFVGTVASTVTTTFDDNVADTALGAELDTTMVAFPSCRYLIAHQNRLVGAGSAVANENDRTVYISNQGEPWACPTLPDLEDPLQGTRITLQGPGAGKITGLQGHGDKVAVFTGGAAFLLTTSDQLLDYSLHRFSNHGCVAHRTIVSVKDMLIWLAPDGVYMAREGAGVSRISDDIQTTVQAISTSDMAKANAFVYNDRYYLCWPSGARWYDLRYGIWGRLTNWTWRASTTTEFSSTASERIYGARASSARVWQMETGTTDNGTAITATWASKDFDCGIPFREKRLHRVGAKWKTATGTATVNLYRGTGTTVEQTATQNLATVLQTGATISVMAQHCEEVLRDEFFRIEVTYAGAASEYMICEVVCEWTDAT